MSALSTRRLSRAELAERVRVLRAEGWTYRRIAAELEISRSYANELRSDPTGEKDRVRKAGYAGTCEVCSAPTDGSNGRSRAPKVCHTCLDRRRHEERYWTAERIVATFREFNEKIGRAPSAADMLAGFPSYRRISPERRAEAAAATAIVPLPHPVVVARELGGWREALEAAGLPQNPTGQPGHRAPRRDRQGRP